MNSRLSKQTCLHQICKSMQKYVGQGGLPKLEMRH